MAVANGGVEASVAHAAAVDPGECASARPDALSPRQKRIAFRLGDE